MRPIKVSGGIFIDWNCSSVRKISDGWFIPNNCQPLTVMDEFNKELDSFIKKWFTPTKGVIGCTSSANSQQE